MKQCRKKCAKKSLQVKIPGSNNKNITFRWHVMRTVSHLEILRLENVQTQMVEVGDHSPPYRPASSGQSVEMRFVGAANEASWSDEIYNPQAKMLFWDGS